MLYSASNAKDFFSVGLDPNANVGVLETARQFAELTMVCQTPGVVVFAGKTTGTAFSTFANMKVMSLIFVGLPF